MRWPLLICFCWGHVAPLHRLRNIFRNSLAPFITQDCTNRCIPPFPLRLRRAFGAGPAVCTVTIEALIVHQADAAEAKLTGFLDHCERTSSADGWSSYSSAFCGQLRMP